MKVTFEQLKEAFNRVLCSRGRRCLCEMLARTTE